MIYEANTTASNVNTQHVRTTALELEYKKMGEFHKWKKFQNTRATKRLNILSEGRTQPFLESMERVSLNFIIRKSAQGPLFE